MSEPKLKLTLRELRAIELALHRAKMDCGAWTSGGDLEDQNENVWESAHDRIHDEIERREKRNTRRGEHD